MPKILAFDTTTAACSVALIDDERCYEESKICHQRHGDWILAMIQSCLDDAECQLSDLDALAFSHGPGSFTGIRIAMSVIQAIAMVTELPVVSVSSLAAMAAAEHDKANTRHIIAAIDARMSEIYFSAQVIGQAAMIEDCLIKPSELPSLPNERWYGIGNAWSVYPELLEVYGDQIIAHNADVYPQAKAIAQCALEAYQRGETLTYAEISPNYIRNKVTN